MISSGTTQEADSPVSNTSEEVQQPDSQPILVNDGASQTDNNRNSPATTNSEEGLLSRSSHVSPAELRRSLRAELNTRLQSSVLLHVGSRISGKQLPKAPRRKSTYLAAFPTTQFTIADEADALDELVSFENPRFSTNMDRPSLIEQSIPSRRSLDFYTSQEEVKQSRIRKSSLAKELSHLEMTEQLMSSRFSLNMVAEVYETSRQQRFSRNAPLRRPLHWPDVGKLDLGNLLADTDRDESPLGR